MPRPRKDGTVAAAPNRRKISEVFLQRGAKPKAAPYCVWDTKQAGLAVLVQPTGHKAWKAVYPYQGKPRWVHLGDANAVGLKAARKLAAQVMAEAAGGKDPLADRRAANGRGTFDQLATRYLVEYAKPNNKSWAQSRALVVRHLLPKWGSKPAQAITRAHVKEVIGAISTTAPVLANQVLAAASAVLAWGVREEVVPLNPCVGVDRNETTARERVLSESEVPRFWAAFDTADKVHALALRMILLTGQRPGEVSHMRYEHIKDNWWEMPGDPVPSLGWPGTKNGQSHRIWIPAPARALIAELAAGGEQPTTGFVFVGRRGGAVDELDASMRTICRDLKVEKLTPHDLRRSHGTMITRLKFGRAAMNRVQNHKEGGIADVYDQYDYETENKQIMETVARKFMAIVDGTDSADDVAGDGKVLEFAAARPR